MRPDSDIIFYDGTCGLCHSFVQWVLNRDPQGIFRFAPLQGETLHRITSEAERQNLPDSVIVRTPEGKLLMRAAAVKYVVTTLQLRGLMRLFAIMPNFVADITYSMIAGIRYRIFGRKKELCPLVPAELRKRFLP